MDPATQRTLAAHTRAFYREHAEAFSRTRDHPWPGWRRVVDRLPAAGALRVLDAGCGNGRFATFLASHPLALRRPLACTGIDACEALLDVARARALPGSRWLAHDLEHDPLPEGPFDLIVAFGLLHHIAGFERRRALIASLAEPLAPGGRLALAFWRFAEHGRFDRRRLDWSRLGGIDPAALEPGDHLLAWGDAGAARYCHASDDDEVEALLARLPLTRYDDFTADGRDGALNRYVVLERPAPPAGPARTGAPRA